MFHVKHSFNNLFVSRETFKRRFYQLITLFIRFYTVTIVFILDIRDINIKKDQHYDKMRQNISCS